MYVLVYIAAAAAANLTVAHFRAYRHVEDSSADASQRRSARCHVNADNRRVGSDQGSYACRVRPNGGYLRRALSEYGTREGCRGENDQENSTCRRKAAGLETHSNAPLG